MSVVIDARDKEIECLSNLEPGSDEKLRQAKVIEILSNIELDDRKHEFDIEKEETRKVEKSNESIYLEFDRKLIWIDRGIRVLEILANPLASLGKTVLNNRTRYRRDEMGYTFETTGVIGSNTFNNALKDKYD